MSKSIPERVGRGATLLDRVKPDWWSSIAPGKLVMWQCDRCVLGQIYGHYFDGMKVIRAAMRDALGSWPFRASDHGFTLHESEKLVARRPELAPGWSELADAWRAEIRRRAGADRPAES